MEKNKKEQLDILQAQMLRWVCEIKLLRQMRIELDAKIQKRRDIISDLERQHEKLSQTGD